MVGLLMERVPDGGSMMGIDRCLPVSLIRGDLVAVRRLEVAAALSRLRGVVVCH